MKLLDGQRDSLPLYKTFSERNKSAITDHAMQRNHVIDFDSVKVIDREDNRKFRCIKEAIGIRCTKDNMNRDQGAYVLEHTYDDILQLSCKDNRN